MDSMSSTPTHGCLEDEQNLAVATCHWPEKRLGLASRLEAELLVYPSLSGHKKVVRFTLSDNTEPC